MKTRVSAVDEWTPVHAATGAAAAGVGLSFPLAITLAVLYEGVEYLHESPRGSKLFGSKRPESGANIAVDLAAFVVGYGIVHGLRRQGPSS